MEIVAYILGGAVIGGLLAAASMFRDRRYNKMMTFCREVVDKNDEQLALIFQHVEIIAKQERELRALRQQNGDPTP